MNEENRISRLNDDCIYLILEWLPLDDLCSFSRTCNRLQALCDYNFRRRKESNMEVNIFLTVGGHLLYDRYVKYFNNFIRNLRIKSLDGTLYSVHVASFVNAKCHPNLQQITILENIDLVQLCVQINSFLERVETLKFSCMSEPQNDLGNPTHPNLPTFNLFNVRQQGNMDAVLRRNYPKLKHFHWQCRRPDLQALELETFLQLNDQIQCIDFSYDNLLVTEQHMGGIMRCIETLTDWTFNLEYFFLDVSRKITLDLFGQFCGYLRVLCDRETFKTMHLKFNHRAIEKNTLLNRYENQLANFKQFTKITLLGDGFFNFVRVLVPYTHLKTIVLNNLQALAGWSDWRNLNELINLVQRQPIIPLPQIEELEINGVLRAQN